MTNLYNHVRDNFAGMIVFGDIHADYVSYKKAHDYALFNNYFFMSLGDLVDRGPSPFETVMHMSARVKERTAGFTIGNHDDKYRRFHKGSNVRFSRDGCKTFDDVGVDRHHEFLSAYTEMIETPVFSGIYHTFDDITLVHAASHPVMWEVGGKFGSTAKSRALVGETSGKMLDDGYPERLYSWIDEIPAGKTVIVGHDRCPVHGEYINKPLVMVNSSGGKVVFLDTGCGKGGFLSAAVIKHNTSMFEFETFIDFK